MSIQEEYKICVLVTEAYGYVVQFRPYQGAKKRKPVASSTKYGLGENAVLRLMECLTPSFSFDIFMDNYFTSFHLLTHLAVKTFEQQMCSTIIDCANVLSLGETAAKKGTWTLSRAHSKQKCSVTLKVVG